MNDLVDFLNARLDEDEAIAKAVYVDPTWEYDGTSGVGGIVFECSDGAWVADKVGPRNGAHITRHDPAHVLRDVAAKRCIISTLQHWPSWAVPGDDGNLPVRIALRHMAAVYAAHPDYDPTWA
ncbi:hypothetical protein HYG77_04840 [Rhodococcus sp. ZPP]|uniref:DUF6221 family protein n=1 Tax=Rhodococcus sp. ZPP TaxID=2749906 RepID=UPI001AD85854|nr:DUF6221 family protein [Rhodococcus sp. ZPP]QTJ64990.1 hypothetical protein HYG77_04840 [Rhodococcus sp. ZPP]